MTVLFVDDEPLVIQDIFLNLDADRLGVSKMLKAGSASEAKALFEQMPIDVIVCDVEMPRVNGIDLLTWVKERYPSTESIIVTSHSTFSYAKDAVRLGCTDYLLKPVVIGELESAILRAVSAQCAAASDTQGYVLNPVVRRAKAYIDDSMNYEALTRTEVASHTFINPDYLDRGFKAELGVSMTQYIAQLKMQKAQILLMQSDMNISEIASTVGYPNLSSFSFMFKQATGESPRAYRQRALKKAANPSTEPAPVRPDTLLQTGE